MLWFDLNSDNMRGLIRDGKHFWYFMLVCSKCVSLISNILATFLREDYPHIGHVSSMANIVVNFAGFRLNIIGMV